MNGTRWWLAAWVFGLAGVGCGGGQSGTESERAATKCTVVESRPVAATEATPLGSPAEVAARLEATYTAPLRWYARSSSTNDGSSMDTQLQLSVTPDLQRALFVDRQPEPGGCGATLEMEAVASFVTEDGTFAEELHGTLTFGTLAYDATQGFWFEANLPVDDLRGTYDANGVSDAYGDPYYEFRTKLSPLSGSCWMNGTDRDNDPNTVLVSTPIASWGD